MSKVSLLALGSREASIEGGASSQNLLKPGLLYSDMTSHAYTQHHSSTMTIVSSRVMPSDTHAAPTVTTNQSTTSKKMS
jgi:hypothetical protein